MPLTNPQGWRKRERNAQLRREHKEKMEPIRAARRAHLQKQADNPDPSSMSRQQLLDRLAEHSKMPQFAAMHSDELLRAKVRDLE